ncbi:uncharacterized protein LOC142377303 [Odontesthes bonariensis]|uniref:uncharacterized protein LOC142377303 n=1 Tax=Odontesthes bonariensis TaxID=219752 RepID=UPI003F582545
MFLYMLILMAYYSSRLIQRNQRLKFQIVNAVFTVVVLAPQLYVMGRPKSSRYCGQPLLNNMSAFVALTVIAAGFSVIFTSIDPVPQSLWAAYHVFGLLSCGHGLCTAILTITASECAKTTPELYYMSLTLTVASTFSAGFFMVRGGLWLTNRQPVTETFRNE